MKSILHWALALFFPSVLIFGIIYINADAFLEWKMVEKLAKEGIETQAVVLDKHKIESTKGSDSYCLTYSFELARNNQNQVFQNQKEVDDFIYSQYDTEDTVSILYLRDHPDTSDVVSNDAYEMKVFQVLFMDVILLGFLIFVGRRSVKKDGE